MINARELRLGNLVSYFGKECTVLKLQRENSQWYIGTAKDIYNLVSIYNVEDSFSSIPLSIEWLEKIGFKKTKQHYRQELELPNNKGKLGAIIEGDLVYIEYTEHVTSVHQLQNLCFAICGTELEFNTVPVNK